MRHAAPSQKAAPPVPEGSSFQPGAWPEARAKAYAPQASPRDVTFRAFVGVPVAAEPPLVELLDALKATDADVKPVEPQNLHLTISFLGPVPDEAAPLIAAALHEAARGVEPFTLDLHAVGAFPSARRPRVVWAGIRNPRPVSELAVRVRASLAEAGQPQDSKDFRAHVTLARVRSERGHDRLAAFLRAHGHHELPTLSVRDVRLYKSVLGPAGPAYETVHVEPLGAAS